MASPPKEVHPADATDSTPLLCTVPPAPWLTESADSAPLRSPASEDALARLVHAAQVLHRDPRPLLLVQRVPHLRAVLQQLRDGLLEGRPVHVRVREVVRV